MRVLSPTRIALIVAASCASIPALSQAQSQNLPLATVVSRMEQVQVDSRDHDVAYAVTRQYQLSVPGAQNPNSNVVAQINFVPPGAKDYTILKTEGSGRGESIVRKVLDHEAQMASHAEQHEVTSRNYDFAMLGREKVGGRDCYVLQLMPKRAATELMRGKVWVDAADFTIHRMEGAPAKSPSLWIRNLTVSIDYAQVNGVWVQTTTKAVADVRFVGTHILTSRELELNPSSVDARSRPSKPSNRSNNRRSAADTAVWVAP